MAEAQPEPGTLVGRYRLVERLGEGAMGVVFRADAEDGSPVAIKLLRHELADSPVYVRRFEREAEVAAHVRHARLVAVLDAGVADGHRYLVTEYVQGRTLGERLAYAGPLAVPELVRLASHLGAGLDALHAHRLVHRDVKPANVLLDEDGAARLADFGLARGPAQTVLTRPGQILGTPAYLAPELVEGGEATPASDLYSLGCVVYESLVGSPPFTSSKLFEVVLAHVQRQPPDPCARRPDVPVAVGEVVQRALAKDPRARPATGRMLAQLLAAAAR